MRVQVLSDIHVEFYSKRQALQLLQRLAVKDVDAVIIAGDFGVPYCEHYRECLAFACQLWKEVIFVPGNHDYWSQDIAEPGASFLTIASKYKNFRCLINSAINIQGHDFFGTTLWYFDDMEDQALSRYWVDHTQIPNGQAVIAAWNETAEKHIEAFIKSPGGLAMHSNPIIITHHMPSMKSVAPEYLSYDTNKYFVFDMEKYIETYPIRYWIHGHTHTSCDYTIGSTKILCNPMGYTRHNGHLENESFNWNLVINV